MHVILSHNCKDLEDKKNHFIFIFEISIYERIILSEAQLAPFLLEVHPYPVKSAVSLAHPLHLLNFSLIVDAHDFLTDPSVVDRITKSLLDPLNILSG